VDVLQGLSTNLRRQGRLAEAVVADRQALELARRALGPEHPTTGTAMIHLADQILDIEGDATGAERLYRRGLELITRHEGDNSIRLLHGLNSLGNLLGARGEAEAEQHLRRALAIRRTASSPEHPQVADQLDKLARELARQGRTEEAESLAHEALALSRRTLGEDHSVITGARLPLLAEIYDRQGRHLEADRTYLAAIEGTPLLGVVPGQMRRAFGRMLIARGDLARAEEQLLASLELLETAYGGPAHPNAQETRRALMELYERWGRPELVERYRVPAGRYVPY
jgi:tetratricopeptide (TPR) repeat protein